MLLLVFGRVYVLCVFVYVLKKQSTLLVNGRTISIGLTARDFFFFGIQLTAWLVRTLRMCLCFVIFAGVWSCVYIMCICVCAQEKVYSFGE